MVLDPASLQLDRRCKKVKADRLDAERMIRALKDWHAGDGDALLGDRQRCRNRRRMIVALKTVKVFKNYLLAV